jgi:DNA-binding NtrC family response regulator
MTAHGTGPNAMQAMQLGAYDFVTKPLDIDQALTTVARALRHMELPARGRRARAQRFRENRDPSNAQDGGTRKVRLIGTSRTTGLQFMA